MYFARILFFCDDELSFDNLSNEPIELFQYGNYTCHAKSQKQADKTKIIIEYGGFESREKAESEGIELLRNIKLEMCKYNNKINISGISGVLDCAEKSVKPAEFTEEGLDMLKNKAIREKKISKDTRVLEDILGLEIYEVISSMNEIYFVAQGLEIKYNTDFKLKRRSFEFENDKLDIVLSFLNSSSLINDRRIRFLLRIMAIEVLVSDKEYNEKNYIEIINNIIKNISCSDKLMERVKNDIGQLKIKSIGKKCKELIEQHCGDKTYFGLDVSKFFNNCYKMRSELVHSGKIDIMELEKYNEPLKQLVIDLIESFSTHTIH
ncbi:hypothetical protein QEW_4460 [Clostridioides difficile CD160]|nr:hypothetical protein QEW_4460 [Clostridioides difficile CD160]